MLEKSLAISLMAILLLSIFLSAEKTEAQPMFGKKFGHMPPGKQQGQVPEQRSNIRIIDTHAHLRGMPGTGGGSSSDTLKWAKTALETMDKFGVQKAFVMPTPNPIQKPNGDYESLIPVVKKWPDRFAFLGGGGSLNPMIQDAIKKGKVTPEMRSDFQKKADNIIQDGAVGFGEMAALHLSFSSSHPFVVAPPDHELFLLLADIAAAHNMPIDLHMEAVTKDTSVPDRFTSPNNPKILKENIGAFERLLEHNPHAKIVWDHIGWDNTGQMTVDLLRKLLEKHPNLYVNVKIDHKTPAKGTFIENSPLDENGKIRPEWVSLIKSFPDRFLIGSDSLYSMTIQPSMILPDLKSFLNQLPSDIANKVANENAALIYRLT